VGGNIWDLDKEKPLKRFTKKCITGDYREKSGSGGGEGVEGVIPNGIERKPTRMG